MRILVLHNNNLPFFLRSSSKFVLSSEDEIESHIIKYDNSIESLSLDSYISRELAFLALYEYDMIVLPFNLNENNYLEYTGLRVACHIRLTKEWNKELTPIVFVGPDSSEDILELSELGDVIKSNNTYLSDKKEEVALVDEFHKFYEKSEAKRKSSKFDVLSTQKHKLFIERLNIKAPANYATHHTIANEWAIIRWIDMFNWKDGAPEIKDKSILDALYFKYLMAKVYCAEGGREMFTKAQKKKNPHDPIINGIEGKTIVYIDDECSKGWDSLLTAIFKNSNAKIIPYYCNVEIEKTELMADINSFVENNPADCYLIDLRLHDDDFGETRSENLSGIQVAKYIKSINKGNQIVIFTASNKTWNYEEAVNTIGAIGYAIKESPEYNYKREETYKNFIRFQNVIQKACSLSYLKDMYCELDTFDTGKVNLSSLYECVDLLNVDKGNANNSLIKTCALSEITFLESFLKKRFQIDGSGNLYKIGLTDSVGNSSRKVFFKTVSENGYHNVIDVDYHESKYLGLLQDGWSEPNLASSKSDLPTIIIPLLINYKIPLKEVKTTVKIKYERNTNIAHGSEQTSLTIEELKNHFNNVIIPILHKEFDSQ